MLKATQLLLESDALQFPSPFLKVIHRYGTLEDSEVLYTRFLQTRSPVLLGPIMLHGDEQIAEDLFKKAINNGSLREHYPIEVLSALSYLGHAATEHLLFDYYAQLHKKELDWELHKVVCLALLNYSCKGYEDIITRETDKCLSASLFPEFIPVLASKTGDHTLAEKMYAHGCGTASSDSNAGLILGIALFGQAYRDRFKAIIWNPEWEAASSATGNRSYTLMGMHSLGISFRELFQDLKNKLTDESPYDETSAMDFLSLLSMNLLTPERYQIKQIKPSQDSVNNLYHALFLEEEGKAIETVPGFIASYVKRHNLDWEYVCEEAVRLSDSYEEEVCRQLELSCYQPVSMDIGRQVQ